MAAKYNPPQESGTISQWVSGVSGYSSQYDDIRWPATMVVGPPKVYPKYGDEPGAWAPSVKDANQFIELQFAESVNIRKIEIYETFHAGGVKAILARDNSGNLVELYSTSHVTSIDSARIFSPPLKSTGFPCREIRLNIDCTACDGWVEIDSVMLHGTRVNQGIAPQMYPPTYPPLYPPMYPPPPLPPQQQQLQQPPQPPRAGETISQWVATVSRHSSQYDNNNWSYTRVKGPPQVFPGYGDIPGAWAPMVKDANQFLELQFAEAVYITKIDIYETFHAGGVKAVLARDNTGNWVELYSTSHVTSINSARIFSPPLKILNAPCREIRLNVDCTACQSWVEIDCVQLHGTRANQGTIPSPPNDESSVTQWVSSVSRYSSQYDAKGWSATMVVGPPRVYPKYGDTYGAWAPSVQDANQFLELQFAEAVYITKIDIYETYHAGGVKAIMARNNAGSWVELYSANHVTSITSARIFSPPLKVLDFSCREIKLIIDCTACQNWVEIDCVQLHGKRFKSEAPPPYSSLVEDMGKMVNNEQFSDVTFLVEGRRVFAKKAIMYARSEYFRALFREHNGKGSIEMKDVTFDNFICMQHYLYTNTIPFGVPCEGLPDVCRVAERFNIGGMRALVAGQIKDRLNEANVIETYVSASKQIPVLDEVKETCLSYISANMNKVVHTPSFKHLPQDLMLEIIQTGTGRMKIN